MSSAVISVGALIALGFLLKGLSLVKILFAILGAGASMWWIGRRIVRGFVARMFRASVEVIKKTMAQFDSDIIVVRFNS